MKHYQITTTEAATLQEVLRKIAAASRRSPTMMAALDIDRHDIKKIVGLLNRLEKK